MKHILFIFCFVGAFAQQVLPDMPNGASFQNFSEPTILPKPEKSVGTAVLLASIFPGLGHFYLGDSNTAGSLMGAAGMELGALGWSVHEGQRQSATFFALTFANTVSYGIYAAYRDARAYNGQAGYQYKMPMDQLADLSAAPFRWSVIKKPEVWGGFMGALAIALCISRFGYPKDMSEKTTKVAPWFPMAAFPVGIGEEASFRGFCQSQFAERLGPWGAVAASSLLFGAAHIGNAHALPKEHRWRYYSYSLPMITAMGVYFGWLTQKNNSLKESVALHSWYDFALIGASAITQSAAIGFPSFSHSFSF